jgi:natural product precursor
MNTIKKIQFRSVSDVLSDYEMKRVVGGYGGYGDGDGDDEDTCLVRCEDGHQEDVSKCPSCKSDPIFSSHGGVKQCSGRSTTCDPDTCS